MPALPSVNIRFPNDVWAGIKRLAAMHGIPASSLVREAVAARVAHFLTHEEIAGLKERIDRLEEALEREKPPE